MVRILISIVVVIGVVVLLANTIGRGGPVLPEMETDAPAETEVASTTETETTPEEAASSSEMVGIDNLITITSPVGNEMITSPVTITGEARGYWFFEASAPVVVTDWDGLIIGEGYIMATEGWMTEDFVPFTGTVTFTVPADTPYRRGTIIVQKDNPSDLPENDAAVEIPVLFGL